MHLGPQVLGRISGHEPAPEGHVAGLPLGRDAVEDVLDVPVLVGVADVEGGHLQTSHRRGKRLVVLRRHHVEVLVQHARPVQAGHAQRDDGLVGALEDRPVHGGPDLERLVHDRPVGLPQLIADGLYLEGLHLAVEHVSAVLERQLVGGGAHHPVDGVRDAHLLVEGEAHDGQADLGGAVDLEVGRDEVGFVVGEVVHVPPEVGILQQHGLAAGGLLARDGPGVRAVLADVALGRARRGRLPFSAEVGRGHVDVVHEAMRVGHHVHAAHREHHADVGVDGIGVRGRVVVHALGERVEVGLEGWLLRVVPALRARRYVVLQHPHRRALVLLTPVLRAPPAGLAVEPEDLVGVAECLRVAVAIEHGGGIRAVDVRHAVLVPEDLVLESRGRGGRRWLAGHAAAGEGRERQCDESASHDVPASILEVVTGGSGQAAARRR